MGKRPDSRQPQAKPAAPAKKRRSRKSVLVTCPACGTRFRTPVREDQSETACLNCDKPIPLPGRAENADRAENAEESDAPAVHKMNIFEAMAEERFAGEVYRPALPFLQGTFSFPWYPEGLFRWVMMSLGCAIVMVLYLAMHWCFARGGWFARAGYAFGFPFGWLSIWTFSYAASCGTTIVTETAAGNDRITGWADPDWREWTGELFGLLPAIMTAVALAFGVGKLVEFLGGPFWIFAGVALFFLLPICLMSAIETGSAFMPFSPFIIKSLGSGAWAWGRFYAASAGLALVWPGSFILGYQVQPFYAAAVTGPFMAIGLLVYPRLLGRLAWCLTDAQGE